MKGRGNSSEPNEPPEFATVATDVSEHRRECDLFASHPHPHHSIDGNWPTVDNTVDGYFQRNSGIFFQRTFWAWAVAYLGTVMPENDGNYAFQPSSRR